MAAAVGDYRPVNCEIKKIKRGRGEAQFQLVQNPDILREISRIKQRQVVVGFAAETHDLEAEARRKLQDKNLDFIVANDVTRKDAGFAVDTNQVTILSRQGQPERLPLLSKTEVAELILDRVAELLESASGEPGGQGGWLRTRWWNCGNWSTACRSGSTTSGVWAGGAYRRSRPPRPTPGKEPRSEKIPTLEEIRQEMGSCQRCKLYPGATNLVFGEGSPSARLMFIGEAPGAEEDLQGRPFVGAAGQVLNNLLNKLGLPREEVYITNVVKSRPRRTGTRSRTKSRPACRS